MQNTLLSGVVTLWLHLTLANRKNYDTAQENIIFSMLVCLVAALAHTGDKFKARSLGDPLGPEFLLEALRPLDSVLRALGTQAV